MSKGTDTNPLYKPAFITGLKSNSKDEGEQRFPNKIEPGFAVEL